MSKTNPYTNPNAKHPMQHASNILACMSSPVNLVPH